MKSNLIRLRDSGIRIKMQVCILSMQKIQNFGSLLQGYSLRKILQGLGHDVSFIDIERIEEDDILREGKCHNYVVETGKHRSFLMKIKGIDRYAINRLRVKKANRHQNELFNDFRKEELQITEDDNGRCYDYCVIGSDEVFNCMTDSWWGFTTQLFGNVRQANNVFTYAASCGATDVTQLPTGMRKKVAEVFQSVCAFSVRDENTRDFVYALSGREAELHLDPVLVGDFDQEIENATMPDELSRPFCVVYSYYNRISNKEEIKGIRNFCKRHKLKIISVGAPQFWIKTHIACTPFQMLKIFQNSSFVITDTFHGTIFSAKYARKYAVMIRESNRNKLKDLIDRLSISSHQLKNTSTIEDIYLLDESKEQIEEIVNSSREKTIRYLSAYIK